uniref:Uncharacterized protein n=1 Tax=Anguilla anguilla TaxID=7936 RepID=A0A0E9WJC9_ANGAN
MNEACLLMQRHLQFEATPAVPPIPSSCSSAFSSYFSLFVYLFK